MTIVFGVFIILHGLVHLLYFGHTNQYFALKPGMTWPAGSWTLSNILNESAVRFLVSLFLVVAGIGFIGGGIGVLFNQAWRRGLIIAIAILSALIFIFFWNGRMQNLDGQGVVGVLFELWLIVMVLFVKWPQVSGSS
jgi:hypothetical protein